MQTNTVIVEVAEGFNAERFTAFVSENRPCGRSPNALVNASWYHNGTGEYCTTVFNAFVRPEYETVHPMRRTCGHPVVLTRVATGMFEGVRGEWFLAKAHAGLKAPYEA